jgi:hypothetical protein
MLLWMSLISAFFTWHTFRDTPHLPMCGRNEVLLRLARLMIEADQREAGKPANSA